LDLEIVIFVFGALPLKICTNVVASVFCYCLMYDFFKT
jgi:hypothetical protein